MSLDALLYTNMKKMSQQYSRRSSSSFCLGSADSGVIRLLKSGLDSQ